MKLEISNNRYAELEHFSQWKTYESLIEGIPHSQMNKDIIKECIKRASNISPCNSVYLIEPVEELKSEFISMRGFKPHEIPRTACISCLTNIKTNLP
jgi:hypothetical protein